MRQQAVQYDQGAPADLDRCRLDRRPWRRIDRVHRSRIAPAAETLAQRPAMGAPERHQAAVVAVGIVEGDPQAGDGDRRGVEEGRVLMPADLAAEPGSLKMYIDCS